MTVILQRGDRIHLAVPITPTATKADAEEELKAALARLSPAYAAAGITITAWTGSTTLDRPAVVAVFRGVELDRKQLDSKDPAAYLRRPQ